MPIVFTVDHSRSEVHGVAVGSVSYADIERHLMQERHFGGLHYREFVDARGVGLTLTPDEIRRIVDLVRSASQEVAFGRTAVLVSSDYVFGMVRMLEMLMEDVCEVRPFRGEQEARDWLASE